MRSKTVVVIAALVGLQAGCSSSAPSAPDEPAAAPLSYPPAKRDQTAEAHFGTIVADPYRWLENDPHQDPAVAAWIAAEQRTTSAYLAALPMREAFRKSLVSAYDYERLSAPQKAGGRYFFTRKDGRRNQPALYVRDSVAAADRLLVDPARWSQDGSIALAEWRASSDGKHLAYAVQESGSDWRTIRVVDSGTGHVLPDEVRWARFTQIAWAKDGSGFYYSRYPAPTVGNAQGGNSLRNHAVYFHRIGTAQSADELFYATPAKPGQVNSVGTTPDGRYAILYSSADLVRADVSVVDLESRSRTPRKLIENPAERWSVIGNVGTKLFLLTDKDAPRSKIVTVDLATPKAEFADLLPQQNAIMTGGYIVGDRLLVTYLVDAKSQVRRYRFDGTADGVMALPGIGSINAVVGEPRDPEAFFVFASFNQPNTVYRYDVVANRQATWVKPKIAANLEALFVKQVFYASKDGTRIPMFIVRRKDVTGPAPTLLTGYGAFAISMPPAYSAMLTGWLLQGGVVAIPSIRGGGEYGTVWHLAARGATKQKSFDDFIAAAEYLYASKVAAPKGIAVYGDSAGGLLIGAVVNQRPDLFGAALPSVGVMDMLRYNRFTGGQLWVGEYGDPAIAADFKTLLAYSPYHNIRAGQPYPAILATTGDADNRVVPAHSFKYVAALQAADLGPKPRLIRIDEKAGHGAGKPTAQVIEEAADMWAFAARWTGLQAKGGHSASARTH